MQTITTIGLDIAKSVCQVHGVARATTVVADRPRRRTPATVSFTRFFLCGTYDQYILPQMVPH
jgi:hypothetical protein